MPLEGDGAGSPADEPVGAFLQRKRKALKLTGGELGRRAGLSQSKVSRIESGRSTDREAVARMARALGEDETVVLRMAEHAENPDHLMTDFRLADAALAGGQQSFGQLEAAASSIRVFQQAVVPGLLQTSEYARSMLSSFQRLTAAGGTEPPAAAVAEAVAARMARQEILADKAKSFHFVMTESVLVDPICPPAGMVEQLSRIREVADTMANVSVRIIPTGTQLGLPPLNGFVLLDSHMALVDLFNMAFTTKSVADARLYGRVFETFDAGADGEIDSILDKHLTIYAESVLSGARG